MSTEIAARNLADEDRYDMLPVIARRLGLNTRSSISLWRDRALVELNVAVLHSFKAAGVRMVDHHSAAEQFMTHLGREAEQGRETPGDWSWLVPPMSGSSTPVFHRYYAAEGEPGAPSFEAQPEPWRAVVSNASAAAAGCPMHRVA
jgi:nitric-oxide synthase